MTSKVGRWGIVTLTFAAAFTASLVLITAGQTPAGGAVAVDNDDIGGVVTGASGPEAGVWVIAETRGLPTRLIKSVVTDDRGRYVVPDLPSRRIRRVGPRLRPRRFAESRRRRRERSSTSKPLPRPTRKPRRSTIPAQYWFALMQVPPNSDFPGTGDQGNGIAPNMRSQGEWIRQVVNTDGCTGCHQMGGPATRTIPKSILDAVAEFEERVGSTHSGRPGRRRHERAIHASRPSARARRCTRTGPTGSPTANCRRPRPTGRRVASGTS